MQQVIYKPVHGSAESVQAAGVDLAPGVAVSVTDEQAALLFRNQFIVDAKTGKNPNFVCVHCGEDTDADGVFDSVLARTRNSPIEPLVREDGRRSCVDCRGKDAQIKALFDGPKFDDHDEQFVD